MLSLFFFCLGTYELLNYYCRSVKMEDRMVNLNEFVKGIEFRDNIRTLDIITENKGFSCGS